MTRTLAFLAPLALLLTGCDQADIQETATAYYGDLAPDLLSAKVAEMARVMPYYVAGTGLALFVALISVLNALEHARQLGRGEGVRLLAWLGLLAFVGLFMAMEATRSWLPAGHGAIAFLVALVVSGATTTVAGAGAGDRAVLRVGYVAATLTLPLLGALMSRDIYLIDTTASLFIGVAAGILATIVLSTPVRAGLVEFLTRRDKSR